MWQYTGVERPPFAIEPGPGQESVWDYPRPPAVMVDSRRVEVRYGDLLIADTRRAYRVLETANPPAFYLPMEDIYWSLLMPAKNRSVCEWKGAAQYWMLKNAPDRGTVGWSYPNPNPPFALIRDMLSFYPAKVECYVDGERVRSQPGGYYGGWITDEVVGPFKGDPGTGHW